MSKVSPSTDTANKEDAAIYRAAAELVADPRQNWASCYAVNFAARGMRGEFDAPHPASERYSKLFSPRKVNDPDVAWGAEWDDIHGCRVLALCFMAAMVEAGDA